MSVIDFSYPETSVNGQSCPIARATRCTNEQLAYFERPST